jgi:hypothetical protein
MTVRHLEVLVEEPAMEAALDVLLPKMLSDTSFRIYVHSGKSDLLAKLSGRLRGYASWMTPDFRILVIVDCDADDCRELKRRLERAALDAGLATRSTAATADAIRVISRIAIEELEAWFFGDWTAVRRAYPNVRPGVPNQRRYRDPDRIAGGTWQAFEQVLQEAGYFAAGLRKIEAARAIAQHMDPQRNQSKSFRMLRGALADLVA